MKRERVEDLGVINEKLQDLLYRFEADWPYFDSKHNYDAFQERVLKNDNEALYELHMRIRFLKDSLWEIWSIARGDDD